MPEPHKPRDLSTGQYVARHSSIIASTILHNELTIHRAKKMKAILRPNPVTVFPPCPGASGGAAKYRSQAHKVRAHPELEIFPSARFISWQTPSPCAVILDCLLSPCQDFTAQCISFENFGFQPPTRIPSHCPEYAGAHVISHRANPQADSVNFRLPPMSPR